MCRVAAPLLPLVTEEIWRGLTGGRSVHLTDWPDASLFPQDEDLMTLMNRTRAICSSGSALRKAHNLRVRQPLAGLTVAVPEGQRLTGTFESIIADELNLKSVTLLDSAEVSPADFGISQQLKVNARAAGPRLGKQVQQVIKAAKSGDWSVSEDGAVTAGSILLETGEYELATVVDDAAETSARAVTVPPEGGFLVLDTELTDELRGEGIARDLIREVQQFRRIRKFNVSDRIILRLGATSEFQNLIEPHLGLIGKSTLARDIEFGPAPTQEDIGLRSSEISGVNAAATALSTTGHAVKLASGDHVNIYASVVS